MNNIIVIIPTYWTWPSNEKGRPETAAYDHPTPLDGESTLPRLLDDLSQQRGPAFTTLVLTGLAHPDLGPAAAAHMSRLLEPYQDRLDYKVCDASAWDGMQIALESASLPIDGLHLGSYGGIRNLQLLVPHILEADVIVALDDDESVQPDYVARALAYVGQMVNGERVLGLAGPYLQPDGSVLLPEPPPTGNPLRDKGRYINQAMRMLTAGQGELLPAPMALGGNMVFHRQLFTRVPFDPGITRGEDIDYLINARLGGIPWWFDPGLTILHLPPRHYDTPLYQRLREDVFRFIYEREKLRLYGYQRPAWLEPYPGALLGDDMVGAALSALQAEASPELVARFGEPDAILAAAQAHATRHASRYAIFAQRWAGLTSRIAQEEPLRRTLAGAIQGRF